MKTKKKKAILVSLAIFAMVMMAAPVMAEPGDHEMPAENDPFWTFFAAMNHPTDSVNCTAAVTNYVNSQSFDSEEQRQGELQGMLGFCTGVSTMATEMQTDMMSEGVETSLFDNTTDWHHINDLYFQKTDDGVLRGRISFSETIDFMSYRFFTFMNNFGNLVQFNDGYISLNAAMVPDMINYGTTFTMYGLDFSEQPDIYVSNGSTMKIAGSNDLEGIVWDGTAKTLSFTPKHFSSFRAVQKGSKVKTMKISSVKNRTVRYTPKKNNFKIRVKGKNLYKRGSDVSCVLGFQQAERVQTSKNGKTVACTFGMSGFSVKDYYPLSISIIGSGEVTRLEAVKIR